MRECMYVRSYVWKKIPQQYKKRIFPFIPLLSQENFPLRVDDDDEDGGGGGELRKKWHQKQHGKGSSRMRRINSNNNIVCARRTCFIYNVQLTWCSFVDGRECTGDIDTEE